MFQALVMIYTYLYIQLYNYCHTGDYNYHILTGSLETEPIFYTKGRDAMGEAHFTTRKDTASGKHLVTGPV